MGGGASIQGASEASSTDRQKRKSVQQQFEREFGKTSINKVNQLENIPEADNHPVQASSSSKSNELTLNPALFRAKRLFMRPILRKKPVARKVVIKKQNNTALLKEMFRRLDPNLPMSNMNFVTGEVEVAVKYKLLQGVLLVRVGRAKQLKTDVMGRPNPFVTVDLYKSSNPDDTTQQRTAIKERNCEPIFQEILLFDLEERDLADSRLNISAWDANTLGYDDFLGEAIIDLCKLDLHAGENEWYQLRPKVDSSISGSIDVSLTFTPPNVVGVTIHEANNLKMANKLTRSSNPFARIYVTGLPQRLETKVIEQNLNPEWNEHFEFLIHKDEFTKRIIAINVVSCESEAGKQWKRLGDVHIPLSEFDESQSGERHTYCLQDLRHTPYVRSKWVEDGIALELHESLRAHATYALPSFIFKQQHKGKMLLSVRNVQAKTRANLVIMNGTPTDEHGDM